MNVTTGDLALIIKGTYNKGKVVEIIEFHKHHHLGYCWKIRCSTLLKVHKGYSRIALCPDDSLAKLRGTEIDAEFVTDYDKSMQNYNKGPRKPEELKK